MAAPRLPLQREPGVRRWLLRYHVPSIIQVAIIAYAATAWGYWRKVLHPSSWCQLGSANWALPAGHCQLDKRVSTRAAMAA